MSKAKLIAIAPQLVVKDVKTSVAFYRDTLGFAIIGLVGDPPVYGMVMRDNMQIHFAKSDREEIKANKDFLSISHDYIIWVPEIDDFYEELVSKNVKIVEHITKRPYGSREFVFEDSDGHRVLVGD